MDRKYYKLKINNLLLIENIVTIHYFEFSKNFSSKGESHDFWEITYADKGDIILTMGDNRFTLKEGEMAFHKPNEFHSHSADGVTAPNVFIVSFVCKSQAMRFFENKVVVLDKSLVKFVYDIIEESKNTFDLPYSDPELKKMILLKNPLLGGEQTIKNYLEILLIDIMRLETVKGNSDVIFLPNDRASSGISRKAIEFMKENINEKLAIIDFCNALHYNKSYIHQQFKKETGSTVIDYFTRLKIERAKKLLREGNLNITQIAAQLSFDTPNYFSKTFRKTTGLTPLRYKKIHTKN